MWTDVLNVLGFVVFGLYALTSLWLMINVGVQMHLLWHARRARRGVQKPVPAQEGPLPAITVQLPLYNEPFVVRRLLSAVSALDYPRHLLEVQVLDDSTDDTSCLIDDWMAAEAPEGLNIRVLRRPDRSGYKAGALQWGLERCRGELIAIFDADFLPEPSFLRQLVPHFGDPSTGLVQARWGHLNREENALTRIQTYLLDSHFTIEQGGRAAAGYFINFCGTAGIWRKKCIEDAGGWDGAVLSEDLDLSYRAQLKGWKLRYEPTLQVPAELPAGMDAFKVQQFRWTKGMAQMARKNMGRLLQSSLPFPTKLHGVFHMLGSSVFLSLLINGVLTVPLLLFRNINPEIRELSTYAIISSVNLVGLTLFYYFGTRQEAPLPQGGFFRHFPLFLTVYMALSVQNAIAVTQGFLGKASPFVRTPKRGRGGAKAVEEGRKISAVEWTEAALLAYFTGGIIMSVYLDDYFLLLFFGMIGFGLAFLLTHTLGYGRGGGPAKSGRGPLPAKPGIWTRTVPQVATSPRQDS